MDVLIKSLGIGAYGFTDVPHELIFQHKGILYDKAIVVMMEMDREAITSIPDVNFSVEVMRVYMSLGDSISTIAKWLISKGYAAQEGNPLKGLVLFPPLAVGAGLGWFGKHGLLITPQFGSRQRIGCIFVGVNNLPLFEKENPHAWIKDFCSKCGLCARQCPGNAILDKPIAHESGRETCIENEKCFPHFYGVKGENIGCGVCLKVCPFSQIGYERIKQQFHRNRGI